MSSSELTWLTATELAARIRRKEVSAREVMDALRHLPLLRELSPELEEPGWLTHAEPPSVRVGQE